MQQSEKTREALISTAGQLFSASGYKTVSTRTIAERANVKLSAIHYHFGSKENLYIQTCLAAHARGKPTTFGDVIDENPALAKTPKGQAEIIRSTVCRRFHDHFRPDRPEWEAKIILRELADPSNAIETLAETIFRPDTESCTSFYRQIRPGATVEQAWVWADMLYGTILFYSMLREPISLVRGENWFTTDYYQQAANSTAKSMILAAGLDLPPDLC